MSQIDEFLQTIAQLRSPEGCPWDQKQTHETLIPFLNEESAEVVEAILLGNDQAIKDELGDLLLQIALHAEIAREKGSFDFNDVVMAINHKMIRRHPHVFSGVKYDSEGAQTDGWHAIKALENQEKGEQRSYLDGVKASLSGLTTAKNLQAKASQVGFDWGDPWPIMHKIEEELQEVKTEMVAQNQEELQKEIGDLLFAVVNLARHYGIEPEVAIGQTNTKFKNRFKYIETHLNKPLKEATLEEMDHLWEASKRDYE